MNEKYCRRASSPFQGKLQKTGCLWVVQRIHLFMISTRQLNLGGHLKAQKLHDRNTESRKANFWPESKLVPELICSLIHSFIHSCIQLKSIPTQSN